MSTLRPRGVMGRVRGDLLTALLERLEGVDPPRRCSTPPVLVVPLAQPLEANMERAVGQACALLEAGEQEATAATLDTRLVRARSFAEGVLDTLAAEPFDLLVLEKERGGVRDGMAGQIETVLAMADATVAVIRPPVGRA